MPTYLYECIPCRIVLSQVRAVANRDDVIKCSKCESVMYRRLDFGGAQFKGSGFYSTDKRKGSK